jgi:hypothetical protein
MLYAEGKYTDEDPQSQDPRQSLISLPSVTTLTIEDEVSFCGTNMYAVNGARLALPAVTSIVMSQNLSLSVEATGEDSVVDLSSLLNVPNSVQFTETGGGIVLKPDKQYSLLMHVLGLPQPGQDLLLPIPLKMATMTPLPWRALTQSLPLRHAKQRSATLFGREAVRTS